MTRKYVEDSGRIRREVTDEEIVERIKAALAKSNPNVVNARITRNPYSDKYEGEYVNRYGAQCSLCVSVSHLRSYFHTMMFWLKPKSGAFMYESPKSE